MIKTLIDKIQKRNTQTNQDALFNYVSNNTISGEDLDYLLTEYERLKNETTPEKNYARTALILGSKPLIAKGIKKTAAPLTDETIDDCLYNLISIIDKYDASKNASFPTFVVNYTVYFLQRKYRDVKEDATNVISVSLDQHVKEDSDTEMYNMIGDEDVFFEEYEELSPKEKFEQEVRSVQKYLSYLTHDEQYVFLVVNGIYDTQISINNLAKELKVNNGIIRKLYYQAKTKLENLFTTNRTPEQQEFYEKYKDLKFSVLQPKDLKDYKLSVLEDRKKPESKRGKIFNNNYYLMKQKIDKIIESNQLALYKLSVLQEKILYLYYGINTEPLSSSQIAEKLNISLTSATTHLATIKRKLARNISENAVNKSNLLRNEVAEILNENPNNIFLISEEYHDLIKKYYGIGEPAVEVDELSKLFGKSHSEVYRLLGDASSKIKTSYNMYIPLLIDDVETFIRDKNIDIKSLFTPMQLVILKNFYGINQERKDIATITKEYKFHANSAFKSLNQINSKLNSLNGFLSPNVHMPNYLIKNIIKLCKINLEEILDESQLKAINIFITNSFESVDIINSRLNLTTYKSNNLLFSALSKIVNIYNHQLKMNKLKAIHFQGEPQLENDEDKKNKSLLTKQQKQILSAFVGFYGTPLSIVQIAEKMDFSVLKVYKDLKIIKEILNKRFSSLDNGSLLNEVTQAQMAKLGMDANKTSWWNKDFVQSLPLGEILTHYKYRIVSLYFGFEGEPLTVEEIAATLNIKERIVSSNLSMTKYLIKKYVMVNNISYLTDEVEKESKPDDLIPKIEPQEDFITKTRKPRNSYSWWNIDFLLDLPLEEILTPHQYRIVSLRMGFDGTPKSNAEIAEELNSKANTIASIIAQIKNKIKNYMIKNNISYITNISEKKLKPVDLKPIPDINQEERMVELKKIKSKTRCGWWSKEFLIKLPLTEILSPYQYKLVDMNFGFNCESKSYAKIAKELGSKASSVGNNIAFAKKKIKKYLQENGISYLTEEARKELKPIDLKPIPEINQEEKMAELKKIKSKTRGGWWSKEFLIKLPLIEILTPYQYKLVNMSLGLGGESKTYKQIAKELSSNLSSVSNNVAFAKKKIKKYLQENGISYLTEEARKELKPIDLKPIPDINQEEKMAELEAIKGKTRGGWWSKEFLIKLPLTEILSPYQYKLVVMKFGFVEEYKTNEQIAKELGVKASGVANNVAFAKKKIKKYLQENGISYLTEMGSAKRFVPLDAIQNQTNQNEAINYQFDEDKNKIDINEQEQVK